MKHTEPPITKYLHNKAMKTGTPINGTFELSPICNFGCKMCYVRRSKAFVENHGGLHSWKEWLSLAEQCIEKGMVYLLLTGGEPLIYDGFRELYTELSKKGLIISINTNGYFIDEYLELFKKYKPSRINLTLYGMSSKTYESLCDNSGAFDKVMKNIELLINENISVKINCSVTDYNEHELEQMAEFAKNKNVFFEAASYMFPNIRTNGEKFGNNDRFTPEKAGKIKARIREFEFNTPDDFKNYQDSLRNSIKARENVNLAEHDDRRILCRAGTASFWVTWDWKLLACGMMTKPEIKLSDNFSDSWEELKAEISKIRLSKKCVTCPKRMICHACAAMAYCENGNFSLVPEYLCKMTDSFLETIMK